MENFSYLSLIWLYIATLVVYVSYTVIQKAYFGPLSAIPGPWHARLCNWRVKAAVLSGSRANYVHALHKQYGPIVRITPNEVAINDAAGFKDIHRMGSGFLKTNFYEYLNTAGPGVNLGVFNMTNPKDHAARRKLLARGFSQRYLRDQWEDSVRQKVDRAVARIKADSISGTADVFKWWTFLATDVVSLLMFGESLDMLELGHKVPYIEALEKATFCSALSWELPWVYKIGRLLPFPALKSLFYANDLLFEQGSLALKNSKDQGNNTTRTSNVFATIINEAEKDDGNLTDDQVKTEAGNMIVAGSDTTGITLTYLTWIVLKNPDLQKDLEDEVGAVEGPFSDSELEKLPILHAVIEETLRLYGAAPSTLPRVVPKGGAKFGEYFVPEGTTVGTQAWSLHREASLFPNPETFDHTRWLPPSPSSSSSPNPKKVSETSKSIFSPFGAGSRICIGVHLARMELRLGAATFFRECKGAKLAVSTTDASMEPVNFFLIAPRDHRCDIIVGL